jgi:hypothetical protein
MLHRILLSLEPEVNGKSDLIFEVLMAVKMLVRLVGFNKLWTCMQILSPEDQGGMCP